MAKQLRLVNNGAFTEEERTFFRAIITLNVLDSIRTVIFAARDFEVQLSPENQERAETVAHADELTPEIADLIAKLLPDDGIQKALRRKSEYMLTDSAP